MHKYYYEFELCACMRKPTYPGKTILQDLVSFQQEYCSQERVSLVEILQESCKSKNLDREMSVFLHRSCKMFKIFGCCLARL